MSVRGSITSFWSCWANVRFYPLNRTYAELWLQSAIGRDRATKRAFVCHLRRDSQPTRADRSVGAMLIGSAKHAQGARISVSKDNHQGDSSRLPVCAVFVEYQHLSRRFLRNGPLTVRRDRIGPKAATSLHYIYRRTEPGFDGLAGTNLRFSEQGGP